MRILFLCNQWHIEQTPCRTVGSHPLLAAGGHEWVRAVAAPEAHPGDIIFDLSRDTLDDILARFPNGQPDAMVVWEPGYHSLPLGIQAAPFPVVACLSDWNLVMPAQAGMLDVYDHLFTDKRGVRVLGQMGYDNAGFWPMWGHDPDFSRVIPGAERLWDIGMVGNLNADIQRERAPWLARVAALSGRWKVRIAGGVYGEEYTRMINQTKITFNRSIRGEMNMRCYEAAACGSVLFYDEENEEIRDFMEDGVHCVLYNADNLEERLEYYLTHDAERERIADAGRQRMAEISFPKNLNRLADNIEALDLSGRLGQRRILSVSGADLRRRHARQAIGTMSLGCNEMAVEMLEDVLAQEPADAASLNDLAVAYSVKVTKTADPAERRELTGKALQCMTNALQLCPGSAFYAMNLAQMYLLTETHGTALALAQGALSILEANLADPAPETCLAFPQIWNEFRVQSATLYNETRAHPETFAAGRKLLLLHSLGALVAEIAEGQGEAELALLGRRIAAGARPDLGSAQTELARALAAAGDGETALAHLEQGLTTDPFTTKSWPLYLQLLSEHRGREAAALFLDRAFRVLEGVIPAREAWGMSGAVMEMDEVREELRRLSGDWSQEEAGPQVESYVIACLLQGEWERALRLIDELGAASGYAPHLAAACGRMMREGRPEAALRLGLKAVELGPEGAVAWRNLAAAQSACSEKRSAEISLRRAQELEPAAPERTADAASISAPALSLCLITKNEAKNLPRVIRSVQGLATEVIVVDTGSTDETVRVAKRLGARVERFEWVDDFAAARNASLEYATGDWILVMDADDEFPTADIPAVRAALQRAEDVDVLGYFRRYPHEGAQRDSMSVQPRLFRNGRGVHFESPIHEQVVLADGQPAQPGRVLPITVQHHSGIDAGSESGRRARNIRILHRTVERNPDDVRARFYLGLTLFSGDQCEEAIPHLREAIEAAPDGVDFLPKAYACLGDALLKTGQAGQAEHAVREGLRRSPRQPELLFCLGLILRAGNRLDAAAAALESALTGRFGTSLNWHDWACREHKPHMALCDVRIRQGRVAEALEHLDQAEQFTGPAPRYAALRSRLRAALQEAGVAAGR